jgi:hypothetical protein
MSPLFKEVLDVMANYRIKNHFQPDTVLVSENQMYELNREIWSNDCRILGMRMLKVLPNSGGKIRAFRGNLR